MTKRILYTAAHSGFALDQVPLGGGAAICEALTREWDKGPVSYRLIGPGILGEKAPQNKDLVQLSEWKYARFCRAFEKKSTECVLEEPPSSSVVLVNDISEGPDFRALAEKGYPLFAIYHVDVVDYFSKIYLRGWLRPESVAKFYEWILRLPVRSLFPNILGLVAQKQHDSVLYCKGLIVPSQGMKDVLLRCYSFLAPSKVYVIPWGIWPPRVEASEVEAEKRKFLGQQAIPPEAFVILTLSRISPEKGQDRVLEAAALWEKERDFPAGGVWIFIAGEAAYMRGARFEARLRKLASRLKKVRVVFTGYAVGARKQALFEIAHLYVFPSKHESYGLTLMEAMQAGLPALACDSHGARTVMNPRVGVLLPPTAESKIPRLLENALVHLESNRVALRTMGNAAEELAREQPFSGTAKKVAELLRSSR